MAGQGTNSLATDSTPSARSAAGFRCRAEHRQRQSCAGRPSSEITRNYSIELVSRERSQLKKLHRRLLNSDRDGFVDVPKLDLRKTGLCISGPRAWILCWSIRCRKCSGCSRCCRSQWGLHNSYSVGFTSDNSIWLWFSLLIGVKRTVDSDQQI